MRNQKITQSQKFWKWRDEGNPEGDGSAGERVLELYGTIADQSWLDDDITPQMFKEELFSGNGPVTIWLNSPGGDCIAASQIYSMLMDYKGDVTIKIDGIAASAASVIAMAGTTVLMAPTSLIMVHNPMTMAYGNYQDMEKAIEMLNEVKESIMNAYEIRTGLSRARLSHLMDDETWMNAGRAIELGFADGLLTDDKRVKSEDMEAYSFSAKLTEMRLLNQLESRYKPGAAASVENVKPVEIKESNLPEEVIQKQEAEATTGQANKTNVCVDTALTDRTPAIQESIPAIQENIPVIQGTPITELEKRLQLIRP